VSGITSTEHLATFEANFSMGLVRPAIVGILPQYLEFQLDMFPESLSGTSELLCPRVRVDEDGSEVSSTTSGSSLSKGRRSAGNVQVKDWHQHQYNLFMSSPLLY
jgi:hypothetical protein